MPGSKFSRVSFGNETLTTTGIHIILKMNIADHTIYFFKHRLFLSDKDSDIVRRLIELEETILGSYKSGSRKRQYSLKSQVESGFIRTYNENCGIITGPTTVLLKVSGIWLRSDEYGITYKFVIPSQTGDDKSGYHLNNDKKLPSSGPRSNISQSNRALSDCREID